ncbi:MAG: tetratricopeptide repeat protein, partial [Draconibacterium sp.]|nr:tetratricopeptide repeat protein [Draconibacterium sp.]
VIDHLCLIQDIRISPWRSVIQYQNSDKSAAEISKGLNVNYLVETHFSFIDNKTQIVFKLIDGPNNNQISTLPYPLDFDNITTIYQEIAYEMAQQINVKLTPDEKQRIKKGVTKNRIALNYYDKAEEYFSKQSFEKAHESYEKAIELDANFALAYAKLAQLQLNLYNETKEEDFLKRSKTNAKLALVNDNELDVVHIVNALLSENDDDTEGAVKFYEKAIQFNPNSAYSYLRLSSLYSLNELAIPSKSVEYAIKAVQYNTSTQEPKDNAQLYHRASQVLRRYGLYNESLYYNGLARKLDPDRFTYITEHAEIMVEKDRNYSNTIEIATEHRIKNPDNPGPLRCLFRNYYFLENFEAAYECYLKLKEIVEPGEPLFWAKRRFYSRMVIIYKHLGKNDESDNFLNLYITHESGEINRYNNSFFKISLHCLENDIPKAFSFLEELSNEKAFISTTIRMLEDDPIFTDLRAHPEFKRILKKMKTKFGNEKKRVEKSLNEKGLLTVNR